ncbi:hypothetical protein WT25_20195 [Burkholderia territorii]|uniref:hypothetical protein n=1 Tax=Burkholderia territorii TaxID=1503055 RepID=UPI000757D3A4|nr:hypothetical protein [Burkholderia territorii]KVT78859.1 hypothetical protein WT25_20195 [Burkholderia territorii]
MKVDSYDKLQSALLSGRIDACSAFLASRHESDKGSTEYWYWLAQMYYRSGRLLQALDICFKLTREAYGFGTHFHCLADICAHLGVKDIGLSALETLASKPELAGESSYYVRQCGYHYLGEDEAVLRLQRALPYLFCMAKSNIVRAVRCVVRALLLASRPLATPIAVGQR